MPVIVINIMGMPVIVVNIVIVTNCTSISPLPCKPSEVKQPLCNNKG